LKALVHSGAQRRAAVVAAVLLLAIGFLPLFGGPGYEHALACGLILPSCAAIATALDVARADRAVTPIALFARGVASGLALAALGFATALLHGLRVAAMSGSLHAGFCDLPGGARGYALTAAIGTVMGGAWGSVAGWLARRARRTRLACTLLGLAAPLACVVVSVARFYTSPMIFAFDPFVGYFSGTLYDTVIDAGTPLLTYRLGSFCTLSAAALVASAIGRWHEDVGARARLALGACAAIASLVITAEGAALGHWSTSASIATSLGGFRAGPRCDVVYPDGLRRDQVDLLVRDCEEELAHDEAVLGAHLEGRLTAFFFRDAGEKKRLMGAADTYIAKPWRREVYLQVHSYPHPVLGHEVAHVVAGSFGRGPFRIAGGASGLWPNPGLIEGTAVAASPDEDELTDAQWAHAMMELGILPPLGRIFSFGFLGESSAKSYTIAGAFVTWALGRFGSEALRRWYGGEDLPAIVGAPWDALDRDFRASLSTTPLAPEALAYAKAKFDRPSVFGRTCPHVVDALRREADGCRDALQIDRAVRLYRDVLVRDPHDWAARWGLGIVELRYGAQDQQSDGERALTDLAGDEQAPRTWRARTQESLADASLASSDPARWAEARARYEELASRTVEEDEGRTLEVKGYAAAHGGEAREAVLALLIGPPGRPVDAAAGLAETASWARATGDPVAEYVYGKNLMTREMWADASGLFDRAIASGEPTPRIARELLRQRAIAACALGDRDRGAIDAARRRIEDAAGPFASSTGRREWALTFLERCTPR
jgi:hypothetical protein